jgi:hypothetical protein
VIDMLKAEAARREEQLEHLAQVRALSQAVAWAISAVEKNDLQAFDAQVAKQEAICDRLSAIQWTPSSIAAPGENPDEPLLQEIRRAHMGLAQLNRAYAALLKRASRSIGTIVAFYRSQREGYERHPLPLPQRHSLSCEV